MALEVVGPYVSQTLSAFTVATIAYIMREALRLSKQVNENQRNLEEAKSDIQELKEKVME